MAHAHKKKQRHVATCIGIIVLVGLVFGVSGCSDDKTPSSEPLVKTGRFLDSAVQGLTYTCDDLTGTTDDEGTFYYYEGSTISFKLGALSIGEAVLARPVITPLNILPSASGRTDTRVTNMVRFFLALDEDKDPDNGISIPSNIIANAPSESVDFSNESSIEDLLDVLYADEPPSLGTTDEAEGHLYKTLFYQLVEEAAVNNDLPGVVLGTILPGTTDPWFVTYGESDTEHHTPITENDKFRVGSVTKTFLGVVILQLAEEGKLGLDDPVETYLPGVVPNGSNITIRMLLNHTSGIFNFIKNDDFLWIYIGEPLEEMEHEEVLSYAFSKLPYFAPGEEWTYSNTNYVILGMVIESLTGKPLEEVVETRCLVPLNLTSTLMPERGVSGIEGDHAKGYIDLFEETYYIEGVMGADLVDYTAHEPSQVWGNGNMVSSIPDLMTWISAIAEGSLLSPAYVDEMFTYVPAQHDLEFGLGIAHIAALGAIGHAGQILGYDCSMIYQLDYNLPVCSCTNRTISDGGNIRDLLVLDALDLLLDGE